MSQPGLLQSEAAARQHSLWDHAPNWRNLIMVASVLTLAALATPLLLPQPGDVGFSPAHAPAHSAAAPLPDGPATPAPNAALSPAQPEAGGPAQSAVHASGAHSPAAPMANLPVGTVVVPQGVLTRVRQHNRRGQGHNWPIAITIVSPPAHGTISTRVTTAPVTYSNGMTLISTMMQIFYQSAPGYTGIDSFTYKRTSTDPSDPLNANTYTTTIDVK